MIKKLLATTILITSLAACDDATVASHNLSKASDNFQVHRRIVFYNGVTGGYILTLEGRCSLHDSSSQLAVTCKTGEEQYKKHFLGLSDNVTYFAEQTEGKYVSKYHYKVLFKPTVILPDIDLNKLSK